MAHAYWIDTTTRETTRGKVADASHLMERSRRTAIDAEYEVGRRVASEWWRADLYRDSAPTDAAPVAAPVDVAALAARLADQARP